MVVSSSLGCFSSQRSPRGWFSRSVAMFLPSPTAFAAWREVDLNRRAASRLAGFDPSQGALNDHGVGELLKANHLLIR